MRCRRRVPGVLINVCGVDQILVLVIRQRERIVEEIDHGDEENGEGEGKDEDVRGELRGEPSDEATAKFEDYGAWPRRELRVELGS